MAKKKMMMSCDCGCATWLKWLVLLFGVLYLLGDLGMMPWFAPGGTQVINWWTLAFLLLGLKWVME